MSWLPPSSWQTTHHHIEGQNSRAHTGEDSSGAGADARGGTALSSHIDSSREAAAGHMVGGKLEAESSSSTGSRVRAQLPGGMGDSSHEDRVQAGGIVGGSNSSTSDATGAVSGPQTGHAVLLDIPPEDTAGVDHRELEGDYAVDPANAITQRMVYEQAIYLHAVCLLCLGRQGRELQLIASKREPPYLKSQYSLA